MLPGDGVFAPSSGAVSCRPARCHHDRLGLLLLRSAAAASAASTRRAASRRAKAQRTCWLGLVYAACSLVYRATCASGSGSDAGCHSCGCVSSLLVASSLMSQLFKSSALQMRRSNVAVSHSRQHKLLYVGC